MRTTNPFLGENTFADLRPSHGVMTVSGTVNKVLLLLGLTILAGYNTWQFIAGNPDVLADLGKYNAFLGVAALAVAILITFVKHLSPYLATPYAALQGVAMGGLSYKLLSGAGAIPLMALTLTLLTLIGLLIAYRSGLIKVTENFKLGVVAATFALVAGQLIIFAVGGMDWVFGLASFWSILFQLFIVVIASMNLVMDFDFIEAGADSRAPKYMEWYSAFAVLVTMVWLYVSILRMLARRNND